MSPYERRSAFPRRVATRWITSADLFPNQLCADQLIVAGTVVYSPVQIVFRVVVDEIIFHVTGTAAGNVIVGIYKDNGDTPIGGKLLVQSASTSIAGLSTRVNAIAITPTVLDAGLYWIALANDTNITSVILSIATTAIQTFNKAIAYAALADPCPAGLAASWGIVFVGFRVKSIG